MLELEGKKDVTDAKRHQQLKFDLIAGTFFLSLITGLTILFDLDVLIQSSFYLDGHWIFEDNKILNIFYKYGSFPGILLVIGALVIVPLSYQSSGFYKLRRFAFFLMFCLAIGPGLIVNLVLKENWGRPRPREIELFGGDSQFWPILCRCGKKEGKSFPCGHCSMAFFLLTPFFYYRSRNKKVAQLFLFGGLFISGVMGLARISAGGHFFSDVLWSGGLIWLTAAIGAFIFKLNDKIDPKSFSVNQKLKKRMALFTYVLLPIVLIGVMVATPYSESKSFGLPEEAVELYEQITTEFIVGNLHLREGNNYSIDYRSDGFGFPTSRLIMRWDKEAGHFFQEKMGIFTELTNMINLQIPDHNGMSNIIILEEGDIYLDTELSGTVTIRILKGDFICNVPESRFEKSIDASGNLLLKFSLGGLLTVER